MIEYIGYIAAVLLSFCAIPQAVMCIFTGNADGISDLFLLTWYLGEILMLAFCIATIGPNGPLFYNYLVNTLLLTVIFKYKYFPRR